MPVQRKGDISQRQEVPTHRKTELVATLQSVMPELLGVNEPETQVKPRVRRRTGFFSRFPAQILTLLGFLYIVQTVSIQLGWLQTDYMRTSAIYTAVAGNGQSHDLDLNSSYHTSKAIVVSSSAADDTSWLHEHFSDWHLNIYLVQQPDANHTLVEQKASKAAVYLTYIINNYDNLPGVTIFHHPNRFQRHTDDPMFDSVNPIKNLHLPFLHQQGYVSLRCSGDPGCSPVAESQRDTFNDLIAEAWPQLFANREVPEAVASPCCGEFGVTKAQIQKRPVSDYERIRQWLWMTDVPSDSAAHLIENLWHIIFSRPGMDCLDAETCYCQKYGVCNLSCPNNLVCRGRFYTIPFDIDIPIAWPYKGQDDFGLRRYGWWQRWYPNETFGLEWMDPDNLEAEEFSSGNIDFPKNGTDLDEIGDKEFTPFESHDVEGKT